MWELAGNFDVTFSQDAEKYAMGAVMEESISFATVCHEELLLFLFPRAPSCHLASVAQHFLDHHQ